MRYAILVSILLMTSCSMFIADAEKIATDPKVIQDAESLGEEIMKDII